MPAPFRDNLSSTLVKSSAHSGKAPGPPGAVALAVDAARRASDSAICYTSPSSPRTVSFLRALPGLDISFHLLTGSLVRLPGDTCTRPGLNFLAQRLGVAFLLLHPSPGGGCPGEPQCTCFCVRLSPLTLGGLESPPPHRLCSLK